MTTHTKKCSICPEQLTIMVLQKTPCDPPCQPRKMLGKSWHKLHGYNSGCKCAELAHNNSLVDTNQAQINDIHLQLDELSSNWKTLNDIMAEMAYDNQELISNINQKLIELNKQLEMDDDAVCEKCGDSCNPFNQMDGHMKCPDCELFYTQSISYLQHRLEMEPDSVGDCVCSFPSFIINDGIQSCSKCGENDHYKSGVVADHSDDDDDDIHICGETGKQYDTDPNPKLGCGIRCDDENGMIGNISYCIGCMEK
jgi:hypothetical protein